MLLARYLSKMFKEGGIILIDSNGQKYICGSPNKERPLTLKLLNKDLNWKLLIHPELYLGEEYFKHNLDIENGTMYDFLCLCLKNIGRGEVNSYSAVLNKFLAIIKKITSYNNPKLSRKNIQHHYDRGEELYDLFLDKKYKLYSCA